MPALRLPIWTCVEYNSKVGTVVIVLPKPVHGELEIWLQRCTIRDVTPVVVWATVHVIRTTYSTLVLAATVASTVHHTTRCAHRTCADLVRTYYVFALIKLDS